MIDLLYRAIGSPLGIVVLTNNPERLRQKLYALRRESHDPGLEELSFAPSPVEPNQLWIINRGAIQDGTWKERLRGEAETGPAESNTEPGPSGLQEIIDYPPRD